MCAQSVVGGGVAGTAHQHHAVGLHDRRRPASVRVFVAVRQRGRPGAAAAAVRQQASYRQPRRVGRRRRRAVRRDRGHVPEVRRRPRRRPAVDSVRRKSSLSGIVRVT